MKINKNIEYQDVLCMYNSTIYEIHQNCKTLSSSSPYLSIGFLSTSSKSTNEIVFIDELSPPNCPLNVEARLATKWNWPQTDGLSPTFRLRRSVRLGRLRQVKLPWRHLSWKFVRTIWKFITKILLSFLNNSQSIWHLNCIGQMRLATVFWDTKYE